MCGWGDDYAGAGCDKAGAGDGGGCGDGGNADCGGCNGDDDEDVD